jgi:hypothetical protein
MRGKFPLQSCRSIVSDWSKVTTQVQGPDYCRGYMTSLLAQAIADLPKKKQMEMLHLLADSITEMNMSYKNNTF